MERLEHQPLARLLVICWVLVAATTTPASGDGSGGGEPAVPASVEALMRRFAASGIVRARYQETRHLSILEAPIETEGVLYFAPPDWLARYVSRPGSASVVVRGDRAVFRDETGYQLIDLDASDVARYFVENFIVLLRGDLAALQARYRTSFRSGEHGWQLDLEPRSALGQSVIKSVRVTGRTELREMETRETTGDRTVTVFSDVETDVDMAPAELERIFSLDGREDAP